MRWSCTISLTVAAALLTATPVRAVDGIAVSTQVSMLWTTASGGDIMRYTIRDNAVTAATKILDGGGGNASRSTSCGRFPTLNLTGTKIAFMHSIPAGKYVSVMDINGNNIRDLVAIPTNVAGNDDQTYLEWVTLGSVNWIYYMLGGGNDQNEANKRLWRVNVETPSQNEEAVVFSHYVWQFGMTPNATRMFLRLSENQAIGQIFEYLLPGTGSIASATKIDWGAGCAAALSPSGKYLTYASGGTHIWMVVRDWDSIAAGGPQTGLPSFPDINEWATNSAALETHCAWSGEPGGIDVSLGFGTDCNRWSCNSDKWLSFFMGWPEGDGASGRYAFCGSNQVLINWQDRISVNASMNPRACAATDKSAGCDKDAGPSAYRRNDAGDFWVSGPIADVNADLRQYVGVQHRSRTPAVSMAGWGVRRLPSGESIVVAGTDPTARVAVYDVMGKQVASSNGTALLRLPSNRTTLVVVQTLPDGSRQVERIPAAR